MSRNLHHANLLIGTPEEGESYLRSLSNSLKIELKNNPDFCVFKMDTFGIDEARELRLLSTRKALTLRKIFLIAPAHLTLEAENALLKTFEEPPPDTYFFLVAREEGLIAPTLRSRMQTTFLPRSRDIFFEEAEEFLSLPIKNRLLFAKSFADAEKNLPVFLDNLLLFLKKRGEVALLEKVYNIRRFVNDTTITPRLVIEHLSLVL